MPRPLEGVRVLDNGIVQAGTFPARLLADYGAEVIRVENYLRPDVSRSAVFPDGIAGEAYWENGGVYHEQHRNKQYCVGLDVRLHEGRDVFLRLASLSDIVLDSHPPGVMDKLELGYDALREVNPQCIYVTTSGYGYGGPYSEIRSYGMMTEVMCGSGWLNGYPGQPPQRGACPLTDHPSTYHGAFLMLAALIKRKKSGRGMWLDMSQYEIAINVLGDAHLARALGQQAPERVGSVDPGNAFSGCFQCMGEDEWITVSVATPAMWRALIAMVGSEWAARDPFDVPLATAEREQLAAEISRWTSAREPRDAFRELTDAGVAASPVFDVRDLLLDEHLRARGFFVLIDHDIDQVVGRRAWPGLSARTTETPGEVTAGSRAPMLGEHNGIVARDLLGMSDSEYASLVEAGAFGQLPAASGVEMPPEDQEARLTLGPAALRRSAVWDRQHMERLRERFGDGYGRS